ncbi:MAG: transporter substrate-binding domain-containing protein [Deltaproteobacteria bacterium]|nr:MAG: transporter substrate-binding domain-containing protein [Deltaproteobacteria bacterium]
MEAVDVALQVRLQRADVEAVRVAHVARLVAGRRRRVGHGDLPVGDGRLLTFAARRRQRARLSALPATIVRRRAAFFATIVPALAAILAGLLLGGCTPRAPLRGGAPAIPPLRVGTSGDYAPFSSRNPDGTYAGFDIEVARAYAADRGREVVFVPFRWPELGSRLAAGDFDVVMSGVTVRADRLVTGIMTATVARADAVLAVAARASTVDSAATAGRGAAAQPPAGFDRPARTVAVNRGGHLEQVAHARFPHARIVAVDDNTALPAMLARGDADAIVTDTLELAAFDAACAAAPCFRVAARLARDRKAYWLPPGKGALATDLDGWLLERERSGWLPALRARVLRAVATGALNASPASHDGNSAPRDGDAAPDASVAPLDAATASLVEDVRRRLTLMPLVAAAKHAAGRPIEDRAREAAVERDAAREGDSTCDAGIHCRAVHTRRAATRDRPRGRAHRRRARRAGATRRAGRRRRA